MKCESCVVLKNQNLYGLILLLVLGVTWGSGYSIAKYATTSGIHPLSYAFWQSMGPAMVVSFICLMGRHHWRFSAAHWRYYLFCGLVGIAIPNTNMYFAAPHLPAGLLAVIVNTAPIMTYPIALFLRQEKLNVWRMAGVLFGVAGILCIILPQAEMPSLGQLPWLLQTFISPFCFALCAVFITRFYPADGSPLTLAAGMLISSTLFLIPIMLYQHDFYIIQPWSSFPDFMVLVEIALSSLGYVIMFMLLRNAGPVYYSLVGGVVVITGLFWGGKVFHELLSFWEVMAVGLIFLGIAMVTSVQDMTTSASKDSR